MCVLEEEPKQSRACGEGGTLAGEDRSVNRKSQGQGDRQGIGGEAAWANKGVPGRPLDGLQGHGGWI